jgi:valyl-tRNA synthetase
MKVGRRLAMKVLNASRFVLDTEFGVGATTINPVAIIEPVDVALAGRLASVVTKSTEAFEAYDYTTALETVEKFFWEFCDDYLELVKERAYARGGVEVTPAGTESAKATLALALHVQLRLLAPFLPYVTEEVWSWWQEGSVHHATWPTVLEIGSAGAADGSAVEHVATALGGLRGAKSQAKVSMRTELSRAEFSGPAAVLESVRSAESDLRNAGKITGEVVYTETESGELTVTAEIAAEDTPAS